MTHATPEHLPALSGPFQAGDRAQLTGPKGRMNTVTLEKGGEFHSHHGVLPHDSIIGLPDASVIRNTVRRRLKAVCAAALPAVPEGADVVIRALPASASAPSAELSVEFSRSLERIKARA